MTKIQRLGRGQILGIIKEILFDIVCEAGVRTAVQAEIPSSAKLFFKWSLLSTSAAFLLSLFFSLLPNTKRNSAGAGDYCIPS